MMFDSYEDTSRFGKMCEVEILPHIRTFFNRDIKKSGNEYSVHDFYDTDGNLYELRSRSTLSNMYPTTIVSTNKYKVAETLKSDLYFMFKFPDGLYYIKYNKEQFSKYEKKNMRRNNPRVDKHGKLIYDRVKEHILIPVNDLKLIIN